MQGDEQSILGTIRKTREASFDIYLTIDCVQVGFPSHTLQCATACENQCSGTHEHAKKMRHACRYGQALRAYEQACRNYGSPDRASNCRLPHVVLRNASH